MKIKLIVRNYYAKKRGKTSWLTVFIDTLTGKSFYTLPESDNGARGLALVAGYRWENMTELTLEMPSRDYEVFSKNPALMQEHQVVSTLKAWEARP